jgi:hypothetical protein
MKISHFVLGLVSVLAIGTGSLSAQTQGSSQNEKPAPVVRGAGGDIPDSQVFITYESSPALYRVKVPEGWSRTGQGADVTFSDKLNGIHLQTASFSGPLSVASARNKIIPGLEKSLRAVNVTGVSTVSRKGGEAVVVTYESNSEPDSVTGRQIRLENKAYLFSANGRLAILSMWAPVGADNVDQWNLISDSFRWQ